MEMECKLKRFVLPILFFFALLQSATALTLDEIIVKAKDGKNYKSLEYSTQSAVLSLQRSILKSGDSYAVGIRNASFSNFNSDLSYNLVPYAEYSSNKDNKTTVSVSVPVSRTGVEGLYEPSVSVSQKVLFDGIKDNVDELLKEKARLQIYQEEQRMELQFRKNILGLLKSLISSESSFVESERNYNSVRNRFDNDKASGAIEEGTTKYATRYSELLSSETSYKSAAIALNSARMNFRNETGFEIEDLTEINVGQPQKTDFVLKNDGNTAVLIARLQAQIDEVRYGVFKYNDKNVLDINADAGVALETAGSKYRNSSLDLGVSYRGDYVSAGVSGGFVHREGSIFPKVSFELTLHNDVNDEITGKQEQSLLISMQTSHIDSMEALFSYVKDANEMVSRLGNFDSSLRQTESNFSSARLSYESSQLLHANGYMTDRDFDSACKEFKTAQLKYISAMIDLVLMNCEAELLNI